jgi:hypothetical protein
MVILIGLFANRCGRVIDVLPNAMIRVGCHRLIEVSTRQGRHYREHFATRQPHLPATVKRRLCKSSRTETRNLRLNHPEIVVRSRLLHRVIIPYKGNLFGLQSRRASSRTLS